MSARPPLTPEQVDEIQRTLFEGAMSRPSGTATVGGIEMPDFSQPRRRIPFKIDDDVFDAYPALDVDTTMEFMNLADRWDVGTAEEAKQVLRQLFELALKPESYERFERRLRDRDNPIDLRSIPGIIAYVLEKWGLRPTPPPSDSSAGPGSPDGGTSSEVTPLSAVPTSADFPSTSS